MIYQLKLVLGNWKYTCLHNALFGIPHLYLLPDKERKLFIPKLSDFGSRTPACGGQALWVRDFNGFRFTHWV